MREFCVDYARRLQVNVRSFAGDVRGNFAIMTGILLVPLVGFSALALDHWAVSTAKSEIENAADAAALAIINRAAAVMRESGHRTKASQQGRNAGNDQFDANVGKIPDTKINERTSSLEIKGFTLESKIVWTARSTTRFSSLFNWRRQPLDGESSAAVTLPAYTQIYLLIDNSGSMGIGATVEAQDQLSKVTNCAVACHLPNQNGYELALKNGIKTRIDIVRDALTEMAKSLEVNATTPNLIKIAVSTFSNATADIIQINDKSALDKIAFQEALKTSNQNGGLGLTRVGGGTDFHGNLPDFNNKKLIKRSGTGFSESDPIIYVVFITDGVEHTQEKTPTWWKVDNDLQGKLVTPHPEVVDGHATYVYEGKTRSDTGWIQTLNPNLCKPIKDKGVKLLTLEIKYLVPELKHWGHGPSGNDIRFGWIRDNLHRQGKTANNTIVNDRFTECASPGESYRASTAEEIQSTITKIFDKITPRPPRLLK